MTHCGMLNDGNEDRTFLSDLKEALLLIECDDEERGVIREIVESYQKKVDFPYVACFSKQDDLLAQWIAYGDNGKGVSIGLDMNKLSYFDLSLTSHNGGSKYLIDEITYYDDNREFMCKLLSAALINFRKGLKKEEVIGKTISALDNLSIYNKNSAYKHEEEVRIVYKPCYIGMLDNLLEKSVEKKCDIEFVVSDSKIKSLFRYHIPENALKSITLGPQCKIDFNQLTLFLNKYAPRVRKENNVFYSKINYR